MNKQVSAVAHRSSKPSGGKRDVHSHEIKRAENGFTSHTRFAPSKDKKGFDQYEEPQLNVHETLDGALSHARTVFGGAAKKKAAAHEKAESKSFEKGEKEGASEGEDSE